jgi:tetratricopeptide (TPR) repeat protein
MSLKPKTSKRLLILAGILVATAGGVATLVFVRQGQQQRAVTNARADGMRLFQEKKYYEAMGALSKYLPKNENDREAVLAYAKCREMIEEPKGEHILQAITHYQRALSLDRSDVQTARHLLELMPLAALNIETRELAMKLRPEQLDACTKADLDVMRAEANARTASNPADPVGEALLRRILELDPADLPARVVLVEHLRERKRVPDALEVAGGVPNLSTPDGAARRRLLTSLARRDESAFDANGEVFAALCDITGLDPVTAGPSRAVQFTSSLEVLRTAALFDGLGAYAHGLAVLLEGHRQFQDPVVERLVARRTWMAGRASDTLALFSDVDLGVAGTHSDILVFRALALVDLGRPDEARAIATALAGRRGDFRAAAWSKALNVRAADPRPAPDKALVVYAEALQIADDDPVLLLYQGDEFERLGKIDDARKSWEKSSRSSLAAGWMQPSLRRAYLALSQNQPNAALRAAQEAFRIAPRSMGAFSALFRSYIALVESGASSSADPEQLLSTANRIDAELALSQGASDVQAFRSTILPGRVILTTRTQGVDAGKRMLRDALDAATSPNADALFSLCEVNRAYRLGADDLLLTKLQAAESGTARVALMLAMREFDNGNMTTGLAQLTSGAASAPADQRIAWGRARATYLDRTQSPLAAQAWLDLASTHAADIEVQLAALASPAIATSPQAVSTLLDRLGQLSKFTPDSAPPQLRLVRARSLLANPVTQANRRVAIDLLRSLVVQEPDIFEARIALILALTMDKPEAGISPLRPEAIQQVRAIIPLAPDADPWSLELGRLYRAEGDAQAARAEFDRLARSATSTDVRLAAAESLIEMRAFEPAAATLERSVNALVGAQRAVGQTLLARAYLGLGRQSEAAALLQSLDASVLTTTAQVLQLADAMAQAGQEAAGREMLRRLDSVEPSLVQRVLTRARFESRHGTTEQTLALLREASSVTPPSAEAWMALAAFLVEHDKSDEARDSLKAGMAALPNDERLAAMARQLESLAAKPVDLQDLNALAELLEQSPQTRARGQFVRSIEQARASTQLRTPAQVVALRDAMKDDPVVLALLARVLMRMDPPNVESARDVANTAMRLHPSSVEAANAGVDVARAQGDWQVMLDASESLRQLSGEASAVAMVAEAQINLRRFDEAIKTLAPLMDDARKQPNELLHARVLGLYGGAHLLSGKSKAAFDALSPLLGESPNLRNDFWLPAAGSTVTTESEARAWIDAAAKVSGTDDERDQLAIASAYTNAARRFGVAGPGMLARAKVALDPIAAKPNASARVLESLAAILAQSGEADKAMIMLDRVLATGESPDALRMASRLALATDVDRGVSLAQRAVQARADAGAYQTLGLALLAQVQRKSASGDATAAASAAQQATLAFGSVLERMPANFDARLGMIDALEAQGKVAESLSHHESLVNLPELPPGVSRAVLQNNYADAIVRAGKTGMELEKARGMIESAIQAQPLAAFYDTLGSVERARKNRDASIAAYRKAVSLDPAMGAGWAALAELLSEGSDVEKREAVEAAKKALEIPGSLNAAQRARIEQILPPR